MSSSAEHPHQSNAFSRSLTHMLRIPQRYVHPSCPLPCCTEAMETRNATAALAAGSRPTGAVRGAGSGRQDTKTGPRQSLLLVNVRRTIALNVLTHLRGQNCAEGRANVKFLSHLNWQTCCCVVCSAWMVLRLIWLGGGNFLVCSGASLGDVKDATEVQNSCPKVACHAHAGQMYLQYDTTGPWSSTDECPP